MISGGSGFSVQGLISLVVRGTGIDAATAGLRGLEKQARSAGASLQRAGEGMRSFGSSAAGIGRNITLGVTTPLLGIGAVAINAASDLKEAGSAVDTVFKDSAGTIQDFAKTTADAFGISRNQALTTASQLGALFTGIGFGTDQAADFSKGIITAAGDLSSFYDVPTGESLDALRSGLIGETEPLRKFGIFLDAAKVQQRAFEQTGKDTAESLTEQEIIAARYSLIIEGLGAANGDAAKTADSFANRMRRLGAHLADAAATIGTDLLPMAERFAATMLKLVHRFEGLSPGMRRFILIAAGIAAAIGPILIGIGLMAGGLGVVATVFGVLLGPIGLILAAVAGLAIAFHGPLFAAIRIVADALTPLALAFKAAFVSGLGIDKLTGFLPPGLRALERPILLVADALGDLYAAFRHGGIAEFMEVLGEETDQIGQGLSGLANRGIRLLVVGLQRLAGVAIRSAVAGLADLGATLADALLPALSGLGEVLLATVREIPWPTIGQLLVEGLTALGAMASELGSTVRETIEGVDWNGIGQIGGRLLAQAGVFVINQFAAALRNPRPIIEALNFVILSFPLVLYKLLSIVIPIGAQLILGLAQGIYSQRGAIIAALGNVVAAIPGAFVALAGFLLDQGRAIVGWLILGVGERALDLFDVLVGIVDAIITPFENAANLLIFVGVELMDGLIAGVQARYNDVITFVASVITAIPNYIGNASGWLYGVGVDLITGLINGFSARWTQFINYAYGLIAGLPSFVKRILGIGSPSKIFAAIGRDTAAGFFAGFDARWRTGLATVGAGIDALASGAATSGSLASAVRPSSPLSSSVAGFGGTRMITVNARYDLGGIHGLTNQDDIAGELFQRLESANARLIAQIEGAV